MTHGTAPAPIATASLRRQVDKLLDAFDIHSCDQPIQTVAMRQHRRRTVHRRFPWPHDVVVHDVEIREVIPLGHDSLGILLHANSGLAACLVQVTDETLKVPGGKRPCAREVSHAELSRLWAGARLPRSLRTLSS